MILRRVLTTLVALLLTAGMFVALNPASATSSAPAATSEKTSEKTVFFNMFYHGLVTPKRFFMTASSGPWMKNLHWEGWGEHKTVAHGAWISDCASCLGPDRRQVTFTLSKRVYCPIQGVHMYRKAHVKLSRPDKGYKNTTFSFWNTCPPY